MFDANRAIWAYATFTTEDDMNEANTWDNKIEANDALVAAGLFVGAYVAVNGVVVGEDDDGLPVVGASHGTILWPIDTTLAMVAWDDGTRTSCPIADMVKY
jgi:hypothetical protein